MRLSLFITNLLARKDQCFFQNYYDKIRTFIQRPNVEMLFITAIALMSNTAIALELVESFIILNYHE